MRSLRATLLWSREAALHAARNTDRADKRTLAASLSEAAACRERGRNPARNEIRPSHKLLPAFVYDSRICSCRVSATVCVQACMHLSCDASAFSAV